MGDAVAHGARSNHTDQSMAMIASLRKFPFWDKLLEEPESVADHHEN